MPSLPELDSPFPTPFLARYKRQFPNQNGPPPNTDPDRVATATRASTASSYSASLVPLATTATYSTVNTMSLVVDPSAESGSNAKSAAPTSSPTSSIADTPTGQSTAQALFTPQGKLFAVGIVVIGLAVLTLLTCAVITIRCTLRNRRRSRTRSRAQSFTEKNIARRKISSDRASEFWSAGANGPIRGRTQSGGNAVEGTDLLNDGQRPPTRPARRGETEADLRAPGRVHFTPSVMMSDYTGLSIDVQPHGSARSSGANMDTNMSNPLSTNSAVASSNTVVVPQLDRHMSTGTKFTGYTLDQDPFAASPMMPIPTTANPLLSNHSATFPPYGPNSPHTVGDSHTVSSPQFASNFSSSPSNIATGGSSLGSTNMLGLATSPSSPYAPMDTSVAIGTPTSAVMYKSGIDSLMSDPFTYDNVACPGVSTWAGTPHSTSFPSPGVTWSNVNLGVASPPALHIDKTSPGIQTSTLASPYCSSPSLPGSHITSPAPTLGLQSDVSQALNQLRRRMSDSTMATRQSQQTECLYRPALGAISDNDERNSGFFMYNTPGSSRRSLPFVPRLKVSTPPEPEMLQMQPTKTRTEVLQDGSPMYASPISVSDGYHQSSEGNSRSGSGPGTQAGSSSLGHGLASGMGYSAGGRGSREYVDTSPALPSSVRTSVLSYFEKTSNV
ncbi:unnamed protein product [Rhizoctonia solani]|uniref:Uncharacterized protein n=1 Tax=Rhizoctonia solani TaxID=456999 RepID=A0A8H3CG97_9AGAM|nr:unnamed protein product [Rhizoctonia solani]